MYTLTKFFYKFITYIEGYTTISTYGVLKEVLPAVQLLVLEYQTFTLCYTTLALNSNQKNEVANIKYTCILLYINNTLNKLMKY